MSVPRKVIDHVYLVVTVSTHEYTAEEEVACIIALWPACDRWRTAGRADRGGGLSGSCDFGGGGAGGCGV